jgi:hypothetical protein
MVVDVIEVDVVLCIVYKRIETKIIVVLCIPKRIETKIIVVCQYICMHGSLSW